MNRRILLFFLLGVLPLSFLSAKPVHAANLASEDNESKSLETNDKAPLFGEIEAQVQQALEQGKPIPIELLEGQNNEYDEESYDFFGLEDQVPIDFEGEYTKGRMAFLFGYYDVASKLWQPLADENYAKAEASIGWMYHTGKGREQSYKKAMAWYLKAARQNHSIAQNNVGVLYEEGWGTKKDYKKAVKWYRESASLGYSYGQYNLGKMLLDGRGVKKNNKDARYWLELASLQGVKQATKLLKNKNKWIFPSNHPVSKAVVKPEIKIRRNDWLLAQNSRHYTLQLMFKKDEDSLLRAIYHSGLSGSVAYFKNVINGKEGYSLVYGAFASYREAQDKLKSLPANVSESSPTIHRFGEIQDIVNKLKVKTRAQK